MAGVTSLWSKGWMSSSVMASLVDLRMSSVTSVIPHFCNDFLIFEGSSYVSIATCTKRLAAIQMRLSGTYTEYVKKSVLTCRIWELNSDGNNTAEGLRSKLKDAMLFFAIEQLDEWL
jgi:hypothetical protein